MTTVEELIEKLQKLPKDLPILIAENNWNSFSYFDLDDKELTISGYNRYGNNLNVGIYKLTKELEKQGYTDEDVYEYPCLVLG